MDSSLPELWQVAGPSNAFLPAISKNSQFILAFVLLLLGVLSIGVFALNRSFLSIPTLGLPASIAIAFGTVYMFCAVGVHV